VGELREKQNKAFFFLNFKKNVEVDIKGKMEILDSL
jgi:hypothetical protein